VCYDSRASCGSLLALLTVGGAVLLGFGLGGLVDSAVRLPQAYEATLGFLPSVTVLPRLHDWSTELSVAGLVLLLPSWALFRSRAYRLVGGAILTGIGLFGLAAGAIVQLMQPAVYALSVGNAALLIWSVSMTTGGLDLFAQSKSPMRAALQSLFG